MTAESIPIRYRYSEVYVKATIEQKLLPRLNIVAIQGGEKKEIRLTFQGYIKIYRSGP